MLGSFGRLLRAVTEGPDPARIPAPTEVIPTIELAKPPMDWLYSADIFSYGGYAVEAAGAGVQSNVALMIPADTDVIATVTGVSARTSTSQLVLKMAKNADLSAFDNDGEEWGLDPRVEYEYAAMVSGRPPSGRILTDQAAQPGQVVHILTVQCDDGTNMHYSLFQDIVVLVPGYSLTVAPNADNHECRCSFFWRERRITDEEKAGVDPRIFV